MPDHARTNSTLLPPYLLEAIEDLPPRLTRKRGAVELARLLGIEISYRSLEVWPLPVQLVCGKALVSTVALLEMAYAKLEAAPVMMGGRRATPVRQASKKPSPAEAQV